MYVTNSLQFKQVSTCIVLIVDVWVFMGFVEMVSGSAQSHDVSLEG